VEDPSTFIWAYDLKTQKKIATLEAPAPVWSMQATGDDKPLLLGTDVEGGLQIFDLKPTSTPAAWQSRKTATRP
jgi:methylamine dehydrogenase heavy chain